jgi:Family of unknown function (DUF6049)
VSLPRRTGAGLLAVLVLLGLVALAPGAAAQQNGDPSEAFELTLDRIDAWAGPDRPLSVRLRVRNPEGEPVRATSVQLLAGGPIGTRSELQGRLTATEPPAPQTALGTTPIDSGPIPTGGQAALPTLRFPLPESIGAGDQGAVVPIRFLVTGETSAGPRQQFLDTYVVYVSEQVANPLRLSLLAPVTEPTHRTPDEVFVDADLARLLGPNGSLGAVVGELAKPGAPPVSLAVDPLVVEEAQAMVANTWRLRPAGQAEPVDVPSTDPRSEAARVFLAQLGKAATRQGVPLNALPYATGDLVALVRNGLEADAFALIAKGRRDLEARLGSRPDESLGWPTGGAIDAPTLKTLSAANVNTVVVSQGLLPVDSFQTQNAPVPLAGGGQTALVPDPGLSVAVTDRRSRDAPAVYAQRILAETAIAWLERPGGTTPKARGILIAPPHSWRPAPAFFSAMVGGLGGAPWLDVVPVQTLASTVPPGPDDDGRTLAPYSQKLVDAELPGGYLSTVESARESLTSFRSTVGLGYGPLDQYSRDLYVAESAWYRRSAPRFRGVLYVRAVNDGISSVYKKVQVRDTAVTLTSRDGKIQVTTTNASDVPVTVRVRLSSPKVDIPQPVSDTITLAPKSGDTQLRQVRTRATGTFPVKVEVLTGDGRVRIADAEIVVRSTALNRVTLVLMVGALVFLLVWWLRKRVQLRAARAQGSQSNQGSGW